MRSILLATILAFAAASAAVAQDSYKGDVAVTYDWVRTNAGPGQCGCFGINGASVSASWNFRGPWSAVTEIGVGHTSNASSTGKSLTLTSYLAGARYYIPHPWFEGAHKPRPFAQVLLGAAHAGGGVAGVGDGTSGFASRMGGGIDVPVNSRFSLRVIQMDYYLTHIANLTNDHQNNLRVGAGIVFR
jgi:outer membrane immunogenic protein